VNNLKAFALLGVGYLLLFAGAYSKGQYATTPWAGLNA
jgi:hypothetical protein